MKTKSQGAKTEIETQTLWTTYCDKWLRCVNSNHIQDGEEEKYLKMGLFE